MAVIIEESELEKIKKELNYFDKEFHKQNDKIMAIIGAIEETFKEIREDSESGIPTLDSDLYYEDSDKAEMMLRNMVIDNLQYILFEKIDKIRKEYKAVD